MQHKKKINKKYRAVSLLRCRSLPGEQDEFGAVLLQALHVGLQRLCGSVATARVNCDTNGAGCLFVDASGLQGGAKIMRLIQGLLSCMQHPHVRYQFRVFFPLLEKAVIRKGVQSIHQENTEIPEIYHHLTAKTLNTQDVLLHISEHSCQHAQMCHFRCFKCYSLLVFGQSSTQT